MKPFRLFYSQDSTDWEIQFFYSAVSSTPRCTILKRQRDMRHGEFAPEQPEYEPCDSYDGELAYKIAKSHLEAVQS